MTVSYINATGGTISLVLTDLAKSLWLWSGLRDPAEVRVQHIAGRASCVADAESRKMRDRSDWKLNPRVFNKINEMFGSLEIDMCASICSSVCSQTHKK